MKTIPAGIQAQLDQDRNTLVWCAKLERLDGTILGFTEHDRHLSIGGTDYEPSSGSSLSAISSSGALAVDNADVTAFLDSDRLKENDLIKGVYDGARLTVFIVDWENPSLESVVIADGTLGEVASGDNTFRVEFRSLKQALQQVVGRRIGRECDVVRLGDARCRADMTSHVFTGTVTNIANSKYFYDTSLAGKGLGWFQHGVLRFTNADGRNTQREYMIQHYDTTTGGFHLVTPFIDTPQVGDTFSVESGCDRRTETCKTKFNNYINFRGFPTVPGRDSMMERPSAI